METKELTVDESMEVVLQLRRSEEKINIQLQGSCKIMDVNTGCIQITLQTRKVYNADFVSKIIKELLQYENIFQGVKGGRVAVRIYCCSLPNDLDKTLLEEKLSIVRNLPYLTDELDVLFFISYFTKKGILSIDEFQDKFEIYQVPRRKRTLLFLKYVLEAEKTCVEAFFHVIKNSRNTHVLEQLKATDREIELIQQSSTTDVKLKQEQNDDSSQEAVLRAIPIEGPKPTGTELRSSGDESNPSTDILYPMRTHSQTSSSFKEYRSLKSGSNSTNAEARLFRGDETESCGYNSEFVTSEHSHSNEFQDDGDTSIQNDWADGDVFTNNPDNEEKEPGAILEKELPGNMQKPK